MSRHISTPEETVCLRTGSLRGDTYAGWDQCPTCGGNVDLSEVQPMSTVVCPHCVKPFAALNDFGPFTLQDVIGQGSIGVVYRAIDNRLGRVVALKLLRDSVSRLQGTPEQLEEEAAFMAAMSVPGIVRVYSTGTENGHFYIAMELLPGGSLQQKIERAGKVSEKDALTVALQVAKGLQAVHWNGMLHRDIKPANILYAADGTAKIADFGLAIPRERIAETATDDILGTPYYLPPERIRGKTEDFRSDIYSLGATLYHALAGRPPFEAATPVLVAAKSINSSPVSIQTFVPQISKHTVLCLARMMAPRPEKRFQSYEELIESLQYALEQRKSRAKPGLKPGAKSKLVKLSAVTRKRPAEDHRLWSWVTLLVLLAIVALAIAFWTGKTGNLWGSPAKLSRPILPSMSASPAL